jgi:hypothetical protein
MAHALNDSVTAAYNSANISPKGLNNHTLLPNIGSRPKPKALAPIINGEAMGPEQSNKSQRGRLAMSMDWGDRNGSMKINPLQQTAVAALGRSNMSQSRK